MNQVLGSNNTVADVPLPATLPVITASATAAVGVAPTYPVALYSHRDGDAISGGLVCRGVAIPAPRGNHVFGDIVNGRLFCTDLESTVAAGPTSALLNSTVNSPSSARAMAWCDASPT